jgi:hypothetical protein
MCVAFADRVAWLDKTGHISNHETITEIQQSASSSTGDSTAKKEQAEAESEPKPSGSKSAPSTELEDTLKQRKGDWRVLQYYVHNMGPLRMLVFAVLTTLFVFLYCFPRK